MSNKKHKGHLPRRPTRFPANDASNPFSEFDGSSTVECLSKASVTTTVGPPHLAPMIRKKVFFKDTSKGKKGGSRKPSAFKKTNGPVARLHSHKANDNGLPPRRHLAPSDLNAIFQAFSLADDSGSTPKKWDLYVPPPAPTKKRYAKTPFSTPPSGSPNMAPSSPILARDFRHTKAAAPVDTNGNFLPPYIVLNEETDDEGDFKMDLDQ